MKLSRTDTGPGRHRWAARSAVLTAAVAAVAVLATAGCGQAPTSAAAPATPDAFVTAGAGTGVDVAALADGTTLQADGSCERLDVVVDLSADTADAPAEARQRAVEVMNAHIAAGQAGLDEAVVAIGAYLPAGHAGGRGFVEGTTGSATATQVALSVPIDAESQAGCVANEADDYLGSFWSRLRADAAAGAAAIAASGIVTAAASLVVGPVLAGSAGGFFFGFTFTLVKTRILNGTVSPVDWGDAIVTGLLATLAGGAIVAIVEGSLASIGEAIAGLAVRRGLGFLGAMGFPQTLAEIQAAVVARVAGGVIQPQLPPGSVSTY